MAKNSNRGSGDERLSNGNGAPMGGMEPIIPLTAQGLTGEDGVEGEYEERAIGDAQYARDSVSDPRDLAERAFNERELSDEERLEMFKMSLFQNQLPTLPELPGYHMCWLTTANPRDSIQGRIRLGYKLVEASELPGWEHSAAQGGQFAGIVSVNEMVAAKLPLRLYEMFMTEAHHNSPLAEEGKLSATIDAIKQQQDSRAPISLEQGTQQLGRNPRGGPLFEGVPGREPRRPYQ